MPDRGAARKRAAVKPTAAQGRRCLVRKGPPQIFAPNVGGERLRLILMHRAKWVNGTVLRYAFFDSPAAWAGTTQLKSQVRESFRRWMAVGIGLRFEEAQERGQAQIRIGFLEGDGHWSYIGRDVLHQGPDDRTMNLDPTDRIASGEYGIDVACHEIGHTFGFPHEHQNPNAGIVWNEPAVYESLGGPPNHWSQETTFENIIKKIPPDDVRGSAWDPDSIMHYPFEKGLIKAPKPYENGLQPAGGLSKQDREWVKSFYPPAAASDDELPLLESRRLKLAAGEEKTFVLKPAATRYYEMRTFGLSDTVLVLHVRDGKKENYLSGDDDSGEERNASIHRRLLAGRTYVLRLRLYYAAIAAETGIMWW